MSAGLYRSPEDYILLYQTELGELGVESAVAGERFSLLTEMRYANGWPHHVLYKRDRGHVSLQVGSQRGVGQHSSCRSVLQAGWDSISTSLKQEGSTSEFSGWGEETTTCASVGQFCKQGGALHVRFCKCERGHISQ